jgi:error-prone DNA polymerase
MGLSEDVTAGLSSQIWGQSDNGADPDRVRELGLNMEDRRLAQTIRLIGEIIGFPRHLSQHVGGFVITKGRLDELCPIENAAMEDCTVIEWDKDDIDTLGILKVDILGLGMLSCIRKSFDLLQEHDRKTLSIATVPQEDPQTYDMLCVADAVGVFQVESRAQMNFLPRMLPRKFYDLVIEVAIVRPGPIQGGMVHPYINRRQGKEQVHFPSKELEDVLGKTLGVPLFQEQAMQIAVVAAGFDPSEADQLRRSLATFRRMGTISTFKDRFINGMLERGYDEDFAQRCFAQIEGFGEYGFPESHAAAFAMLVYVSAWIKRHHPAVFACALLNSQPMGFYAPAQIVRDAREHHIEVRPICVGQHVRTARRGGLGLASWVPSDQRYARRRCGLDRVRARQWLPRSRSGLAARRRCALRTRTIGRGRCVFRHGPHTARCALAGEGDPWAATPAPIQRPN